MVKFKIQVRTDRGVFESAQITSVVGEAKSVKDVAEAYSDIIGDLDNIYFEMEDGDYALFPKAILQNSIIMFVPVA